MGGVLLSSGQVAGEMTLMGNDFTGCCLWKKNITSVVTAMGSSEADQPRAFFLPSELVSSLANTEYLAKGTSPCNKWRRFLFGFLLNFIKVCRF